MVYAMSTIPATEAEFESKVYDHATLVVPVGTLNVYSVADGWKEFFNMQDVNGNIGVEDIVIDGEDGSEPTIMVENGDTSITDTKQKRPDFFRSFLYYLFIFCKVF